MGNMGDFLGGLIVSLIVAIVIFLICRELNCWYWKINERLKQMEDINIKLTAISNKLDIGSKSPEDDSSLAPSISCPQCGQTMPGGSDFCENCGYRLT